MFSLNDLHKTQRGGVALRATFAALIALGSIPGATAISPNFSHVAFAATSDSDDYHFPDKYIDALTTAADWKTISYMQIDTYKWYCNGDCWKNLIGTSYGKDDDFSGADSSEFKSDYLLQLKNQLSANTDKKEIPIKDTYSTIEAALTDPDKFYELYTKVTKNLSSYTTCSDMDGFKESITSKPNNDTDVFLHDITASLFKNMHFYKNIGSYSASEGFVCAVNPEITAPNQCHFYTSDDNGYYYTDYTKYHDYWAFVLSGLDKNWSFSYKNTANGCMLPNRLYDESERLYDVDNKPKYLVQNALKLGNAKAFDAETDYCYGIERLSYELPLHTIAKFVKDVTIQTPKDKVPVANQEALSEKELQAIRAQYKPAFIDALKSDITNVNKIKGLVDRAKVVQKGTNIVISVPGIKTQVVPVKDITQTLDAAKKEATTTINALSHLTRHVRRPYLLRVKKATTIEDINKAVGEAKAADAASADTQTARAALRTKIKDATDILKKDAYQYATSDPKSKFDTALSNAQLALTDFGKSAADLTSFTSALDDAMDNLDGEDKVFDVRKQQALDKLTGYGLSDEDAKPYKDAINHAEDTDGINSVLVALSKKLLAQVIRTADELKTTAAVKYTQASKATKDPFDQQLDKATKLYEAPDAELLDLDTARTDLRDVMGKLDGEAQVQLVSKKNDAKNTLKGYGLSEKDKKQYESDIENAQSEGEVDNLLKAAALKGVKTQAVQAVEEAAKQKKQNLETNKGTSTNQEITDAQGKVDGFVTTAKDAINQAKDEDAVNSKKQEALDNINSVVAENAAKAKLDAAKAQAKKTIGDLKHLEQNDKDDYCGQVDNKSTEDDVNQVVNAAKKADLAKVKDAAKKTINALKNLEQQDKNDFCNKVDQASDEPGVNKVVEDAKAADLAKAKEKATKDIEKMNLTPDQQTAAKEAVNKAKDTDGVDQAVSDAKAAEAKNKLNDAKKAAKEQLNDLGLPEQDKKKAEKEIEDAQDENAVDAALLNAAKAALEKVITDATAKQKEVAYTKATKEKQQAFDGKLEAATTAKDATDATVDSLNKARTELADAMGKLDGKADDKTDLQNKKDKAKEQLKGLGLSKEDEKKFEDEITNAQDDKAVDAALLKAAKAALGKVIEEAKAKKSDVAYTKATKEKQQAFDGKLEAATTAKDATDATVDSLNKARTELADAMGKLDGKADDKTDLQNKKDKAKEQLKGLGLPEQDKKKIEKEIEDAQDDKAVDAALLKAAKAALGKVIEEAKAKKSDVAYTKATKEKQQAFDGKLEAATTAKDATDATVDSLNKARTELTEAMGKLDGKADDKTSLPEKKKAAKEQLGGLDLPEQDKKKIEKEIEDAQDDKAVDAALLKAAKAALGKVIEEAKAKKSDVAYTKATKEKQQAFDGKLEAATTAKDATDATVDSLNKARTELTEAMGALDGKADDKTDLQNKKDKAKEELKDLGLSKEEQKKFEDEITNAQDDKAVDAALLNAAKAALGKVIEEAKAKKSEVAYTKASDDKKQAFDGKLTAATTAKDAPDATVKSLNEARTGLADAMGALDGKADDKTDLQNKKDKAKEELKDLGLSKEDEKKFEDEITNAQDEKAVNAALLKAAKAALGKVIEEAKAKKSDVAYTKATPAKQQEFDGKLEAATTAKAAPDATVDSLNKARTELADAMGKLDGKEDAKTDLQNKKDKAKEMINGLQNLEKKDKDDFCGQVDKASDEPGINKVVEAAKAADLAKAKEKAINNVNNMNLTPEQKKDAKKAIEDANDPAGVTKAVNDAKDKEPKQSEHVYVYDAGYIAESEAADATTALYRLYNPWTHEHLFTTDKAEYDTLVAAGWTGEGSAGMVAVNQGKAVYRLYNPYTGEHHYTTDENELAACVKAGWVNEGIQFYSVQNGDVPVYSMYNPYEKKFYHHYTSDPDEIARMVKDGWVKEGIKWYEAK